ncbi:TPA: hypothetical protein GDO54_018472 [Pyxicephalus adspersus]|uniref:Uncharacterized protein n=1 Tax=Pyxicephalus adspersus TaxID=30357 RepID=A0AAV2ZM61_PYXAD|nr:TPA: hypothetical protein GDO54_018472 [Pyxicephalus adspersus]
MFSEYETLHINVLTARRLTLTKIAIPNHSNRGQLIPASISLPRPVRGHLSLKVATPYSEVKSQSTTSDRVS